MDMLPVGKLFQHSFNVLICMLCQIELAVSHYAQVFHSLNNHPLQFPADN